MKTLDELKKLKEEHQYLIGKFLVRKGHSIKMRIIDVAILPVELFSMIQFPVKSTFLEKGSDVYAIISSGAPPYLREQVQEIFNTYMLV